MMQVVDMMEPTEESAEEAVLVGEEERHILFHNDNYY